MRAGLTLTSSLLREPRSGRWRATSRALGQQGAAAVHVFLDHNLNGRFDAGDEPIAGTRVIAGGSRANTTTGADGTVILSELPADRFVELRLDIASLEDPYWVPPREAVGFVTRPGRVVPVDFPVVPSGEIDGTVLLQTGDRLEGVSRVRLQLLDPSGEVVAEATSAFDGFYLFEKVVPGAYTLRIDPDQLGSLGLEPPPPRPVELAGGEVVSSLDWTLERVSTSRPQREGI